MQVKTTRIVMLLALLIPVRGFSMVDVMYKAGVGACIFVVITILIVIAFIISKIIIIIKKQ